jgi:hypothetical protein
MDRPKYSASAVVSHSSGSGTHSDGDWRRPVKIWNADRTVKKGLVVSTFEEFHRKERISTVKGI